LSHFAIIAVGASAGGVEALQRIVPRLPADLPAAVFIVLHIGSHESHLPWILRLTSRLPVLRAKQEERIAPGHIYVAVPDHHLILAEDGMHLIRGPRENWARPAIDPLFRSAADTFGKRVVGVLLTGQLDDGTSGLARIKHHGGIAVIQDPEDAQFPSMPSNAARHVKVDHIVPLAAMPALLERLARAISSGRPARPLLEDKAMSEGYRLDQPVALTCPECGGSMQRVVENGIPSYRCHIGHALGAKTMLAAQLDRIEYLLAACLAQLTERAELCRQILSDERGDVREKSKTEAVLQQALDRAWRIKRILESEWISLDNGGSNGGSAGSPPTEISK
jgi:two-component system chemotaxis response regulator CheB